MLGNKNGLNVGAVPQPGDVRDTTKEELLASSVAIRMTGDSSSEQVRELHLHIPLEEVLVTSQAEKVSPPPGHQLGQVIRVPHSIPPINRPRLPVSHQHHIKPYRPPPPLLRLGRPTPAPTSSSSLSASVSASTHLRDSVFCSDSGSDSSEGGGAEEGKEEKTEEGREEGREEVSSGSSSQGARCKQYREKSKLKRKAGEEDLCAETERNEKLTKIYNRQKYAIAKLKDYYLKKLSNREFKCGRSRNSESPSSIDTSSPQPLVTIKAEIDLEQDLPIKLETEEEIGEK